MTQPIREFTGSYRFLSNFSLDPLSVRAPGTPWDGEWRTAEHLYQAMKTVDPGEVDRLRSCTTPGLAKRLGRKVKLRSNWEEVKIPCMVQVLVLKFGIGSPLAIRLMNTGDAELLEGNTWGDTFWGVDLETGEGENHLGRLLMQRRELLHALREEDERLSKSLGQMARGEGTVRVPKGES